MELFIFIAEMVIKLTMPFLILFILLGITKKISKFLGISWIKVLFIFIIWVLEIIFIDYDRIKILENLENLEKFLFLFLFPIILIIIFEIIIIILKWSINLLRD